MDNDQYVAVIGLSGRFPEAEKVGDFWERLIQGKESIRFFSDAELLESGVDRALLENPSYVKSRGIIGNADHFDASFFGFTPRESEMIDPQQRVFLECAWHALEDGGYDPSQTEGRIGVFAGAGVPWYLLEIYKNPSLQRSANGISIITGNDKDYLATRLSYKLNLTGTSASVQSACSTSLVAVVMGMHSLLNYQNDLVLAGGVSIQMPEKQGYIYEPGSLDSPDGHCRTFDAKAKGTVFSSGAGVVLLKRLSDAILDGDNIYCVIRGGAINNDGNAKVSYTAPSIKGQLAVEIEALEMAGVNPETISYVEAHGTATQLGDPIEIKALTEAFQFYTQKKQFCAIGSVKSNIGHTDAASGVIGLIKTALSFKNQLLPPNLHFETPNPSIDFENTPFYVNTILKKWEKTPQQPRRALVNSFGVGGTNACVVLEEAPPINSNSPSQRSQSLLLISAKSQSALETLTQNLHEYIQKNPSLNLSDMSYTLEMGRRLCEYRRCIPFFHREDLLNALATNTNPKIISLSSLETHQSVVFMFPGQGNQYPGMGKDLYTNEPLFRDTVDRCCSFLENKLGYEHNLYSMIFSYSESKEVDETIVAQPALFIIEYALATLLISWGMKPTALIGHSIGEYVAACLAQVFSLEDALTIIVKRAQLTQELPRGAMLAVFADEQKTLLLLSPPLEIALINSPKITIVSGDLSDISNFETTLSLQKIAYKRLSTSHAFHSYMMDPLIAPLQKVIASMKLNPPIYPIMSTVTGEWMSSEQAKNALYWAQHARKPVLFSLAIGNLTEENKSLLIEIGPGHSLESSVKHQMTTHTVVGLFPCLTTALGKLWAYGVPISWKSIYKQEHRKRISLPPYPFERKKYSLDFKQAFVSMVTHKEKASIDDWFYFPSWKRAVSCNSWGPSAFFSAEASWILFIHRDALGDLIIKHLKQLNQNITIIYPDVTFHQIDNQTFSLNPNQPQDYDSLLGCLQEKKSVEKKILHLWNISHENCSLENIEELTVTSFYSLLFLQKSLIKHHFLDNLSLLIGANGVFNVTNDSVLPYKSLILGPARCFKNEYPKVKSTVVDIGLSNSDHILDFLSNALLQEAYAPSDELIVAYRHEHRWLPEFQQIPISESVSELRSLQPNGTYLITGGLGGIGLLTARYFAEKCPVNLILTHRSFFPPKNEWNEWLETHFKEDSTSKKIETLQLIESLGSNVFCLQADVSSFRDMEQVENFIQDRFNALNGIIHSAGVAGGGIIPLKTTEAASNVLKPKVQGTLILEALFKHYKLDFFFLFSSITSILGEKGQIDYAAANAFLDAFSEEKNHQKPGSCLSINWGSWFEVGMTLSHPAEPQQKPSLQKKRLQLDEQKNDTSTYLISLDSDHDWFINNHLLKGIPTLVGTAFFNFLTELNKENTKLLIRNIQFISPLMFHPGHSKKLKLQLEKQETDNSYLFLYFSQQQEVQEKGQPLIKGEVLFPVQLREEDQLPSFSLEGLIEETDLKKIELNDKDSPLFLGPRWNCIEKIYRGKENWVARIALLPCFAKDMEAFSIHPALLDQATAFCLPYIVDGLYLPMSYEEIAIYHDLGDSFYSSAILKEKNDQTNTISLDIYIYSLEGKLLIHCLNYTLKKVMATFQSPPKEMNVKNADSNDILPDEGIKAFHRVFSQIVTPQVVIYPKDFRAIIKENTPSAEKETAPIFSSTLYPRPPLLTSHVPPTNEIEKSITEIWEKNLGISGLGIDDNFIELGGNSLTGIQIVVQVADLFKVNFTIEVFLKSPTIRYSSDYVLERLLELLDEEQLEETLSTIG